LILVLGDIKQSQPKAGGKTTLKNVAPSFM